MRRLLRSLASLYVELRRLWRVDAPPPIERQWYDELTDEIEWLDEPCPCGSTFRRIRDIQGRLDDLFVYPDGVSVHPHVIRSPLARARAVVEYQVRQTDRGAEVHVVASEALDIAMLTAALEQALVTVGLAAPQVRVERVEQIARIGVGKLKRFVPLPG